MNRTPSPSESAPSQPAEPTFRRAVLRGLALVLPPLLTIVIFLWAWSIIDHYVLSPIESVARWGLVQATKYYYEVLDDIPPGTQPTAIKIEKDGEYVPIKELLGRVPPNAELRRLVARRGGEVVLLMHKGQEYVSVANGKWIPRHIRDEVEDNPGDVPPVTVNAYYRRFVDINFLPRWRVIPLFLCVFILLLYFLGKFLAAGVGRMVWNGLERMITGLPVIRNVYSSMKQVTDFVFSEQDIAYTRVVAVEYPRKGIWSLGFATGESMLDIRIAANEPVLSVLIPTSPMPATGFTVTVLKSETVDLNITVDQAIQYIVSCGVVVPLSQQQTDLSAKISAAIDARNGDNNGQKKLPSRERSEQNAEEAHVDEASVSQAQPPDQPVD